MLGLVLEPPQQEEAKQARHLVGAQQDLRQVAWPAELWMGVPILVEI